MKIPSHISINKTIQILILFLFVLNLAEGLFAPLFAVYIQDFIVGASFTTIGFAVAVYATTKSIIQIPLARRLDQGKGEKDDFYALLIGAIIGAFYPLILLIINRPWHLYMLEVMAGIGVGCMMAAYYAIFSHHIDRNQQGFEWSLFSVSGLTISVAIGGAVGGIVADVFGFSALLISSAVFNFFGIGILFWLYPYMDGIRRKIGVPR